MKIKARRRANRMAALAASDVSVPVSFAIVGVQKGATTTLYRMLVEHPDVVDGPEKEMRFFIERRNWAEPDYSTYRRPVVRGGHVAGDATPAYLFWPGAMQRLRDYDPALQVMAIFRDPIERAVSHWSMERGRRDGYPDLADAIETYVDDPLPPEDADQPTPRELQYSLFSRSLYGEQLERALPLFPEEQWGLFEFRALITDPRGQIDRATDLLGLDRFDELPPLPHRNQTASVDAGRLPTVAHIERLVRRYADDLSVFERVSGLDTGTWPTRRVLEGSLAVEELHATLVSKLGR